MILVLRKLARTRTAKAHAPQRHRQIKVGRNDRCHCGSGQLQTLLRPHLSRQYPSTVGSNDRLPIVDRLERDYGQGQVFVDIDAIPFGMDFRDHLRGVLDRCDILVAIIGPYWLGPTAGRPRIFNPADWVRIEIETALANGTPIIPVLIDRAPMPEPSDLPESSA